VPGVTQWDLNWLGILAYLFKTIMRIVMNPLVAIRALGDLIRIVLSGGIFTDVEYTMEG